MVDKTKVKLFRPQLWRGRIIRSIRSDLGYASYIWHQEEKEVYREEHRLKEQGKTSLEIENETGLLWEDVYTAWDDYGELHSRKWVGEAFKLSVPIPKHPYQHDAIDDPSG